MLAFLKPTQTGVARIAPAEAIARAKAGELTVIDVREAVEVAASGKADGALHVPLMALRNKADPANPDCLPQLNRTKPVAVYCASGNRSQAACAQLADLGYETVYNIGGLYDWHAAGGAITR
jgi:rhodanese-related sulfurtransferase